MLQACGEPDTITAMLDAFNQLEGVSAKMLDLN